jgi:large subunit ribosomal protein L22
MAIESKAALRFARISPRKARVIVDLVRGKKVSQALDELAFTPKSGAPIVKKLIESALSNAKQADASVNVDTLYVSRATVDKGPNRNMRRWRPRAQGRATPIVKGVSHIALVLTDSAPRMSGRQQFVAERQARRAAAKAAAGGAAKTDEAKGE